MTGIVNTDYSAAMGTPINHPYAYQMTDDFAFYSLYDEAAAATGQPIILRTATVPFLGGSSRRGAW